MTASLAPLRTMRAPSSMPLIRVRAVKGTKVAPSGSSLRVPFLRASSTMLLPSGVSSGMEASTAFSERTVGSTPLTGRNCAAWRFP